MMMRTAALLVLLGAGSLAVDCEVGSTWTANFIRFECYSEGAIVRGVRPIGSAQQPQLFRP